MNPIHLSAESFIKALQGEIVHDEQTGKPHNFLFKRYEINNRKYANVVVIEHVVIDEEVIVGKPQEGVAFPIFNYTIFIIGGEFNSWFSIEGGEFNDRFSISGGEFKEWFSIEGGEFNDRFSISGGEFKDCFHIESGEFTQALEIANTEQGNIHHLRLAHPSFVSNKVVIKGGANLDELTLAQGIASGGALYIYPIALRRLTFKNFINEGKLEITGVQPKASTANHKSQIRISQSNLDNAVFKGVAFDSFSQIIINDSKLGNISTIKGYFPTNHKQIGNDTDTDGTLVQTPAYLAETYNQLHLAMQKQGNHLKDMEYYGQYLHWQLKDAKPWSPAYISLVLHRWSTNFGQSWLKGLGRMLLVGWVAYFLFSICLSEVKLGWQYFTLENVSNHTQYFLQWLLPTHKLNYIPHTRPGLLSTLFDILGRIAMGYMIYQTITAFRRFGRK
jgi:hypothetical protein